jgi:hypothetical protein
MDGLTTPKTKPAAIIPSDDSAMRASSGADARSRFGCRLSAVLEEVVVMSATVPGIPTSSHGCEHPSEPQDANSAASSTREFSPRLRSTLVT